MNPARAYARARFIGIGAGLIVMTVLVAAGGLV